MTFRHKMEAVWFITAWTHREAKGRREVQVPLCLNVLTFRHPDTYRKRGVGPLVLSDGDKTCPVSKHRKALASTDPVSPEPAAGDSCHITNVNEA